MLMLRARYTYICKHTWTDSELGHEPEHVWRVCVACVYVCIAWTVRTDRQRVICDAVSLLCCCRDGSVGFCYGYDCVLPQTKIKSARGFSILTQNKNFVCVCLQFVRGQSGGDGGGGGGGDGGADGDSGR